MLMIRSDTINPTERPIISIKDDFIPIGIISDILHGEFKRNRTIKIENYKKAKECINMMENPYSSNISEQELNQKIQESLKILYDIKE